MRVLIVRLAFAALVAGGVITCSLNAQQPATPELTAQDLRDGLRTRRAGSPTPATTPITGTARSRRSRRRTSIA